MTFSLFHRLTRRQRRLLFWSLGVMLLYTLVGFFVLPPVIRSVAAKQLREFLGREVSIGSVKINPFTYSGTIRQFLISDKDGKLFVSWDEVHANFQFWSLFTRTFVFKEIRTTQPFVRLQVNPDYSLNFSDILDKLAREAAANPKKESSKPISLRIDTLKISGARLSATDLTTRRPFTKIIGPLELTLLNFATNPDNKNPYSFSGSTEEGERFSWSGHFFLDPIRTLGDFSLENISLAKYAPLYQDLVRFELRGGTVDVRASYHIEHGAQTNIARLTNTSVTVRSVQVAESGATNNALEVAHLTIEGVRADAFGRNAEIQSISTTNGRFALRRNADATINLVELSKPSATATNTAGSVQVILQSLTNVIQLLLRSTNAWAGTIHQIRVDDYAVYLEDFATPRPVRVALDDIQVDVRNVSNQPGTNITAAVNSRWNTNGTVKTKTAVSLFPLQVDSELALDGMEIRALDPYLDSFLNLLITQGSVGLQIHAQVVQSTNALPDVSLRGDIWVNDFATLDGIMTEDFLKCGRVSISGIDAKLNPLEIAVKEVALHDAVARLVIGSAQTNNLFAVLKRDMSAPAQAVTNTSATPPAKSAKKGPRIELPTNAIASAQAALPKVSVGAVLLTNAQLQYIDRSLSPGVSLSIGQVNGAISGLSSENLSRADVKLTGKIDNTARMEIAGKINPLGTNQFSDIKVLFQGIELIPTSPYSGKFLGYRLNKGKLSLDLHYQLSGGKLRGENRVTVDQLTLGEKVESPDATKLPVKLGIAILKDRSGKIELDVPVEGTMGDPEFRLGKVITRALLNVFTKVVTSPFAALGSVFGGKGEEVSYQDFAAGSSELTPAAREKLEAVAKGLFERPSLQLEIEGSVDAAADGEALRRQKLLKDFRLKKWTALRKSERSRITPDQVELTPEEHADYLKEAHAAALAKQQSSTNTTGATVKPSLSAQRTTSPSATRTGTQPQIKGATALLKDGGTPVASAPASNLESELILTVELTPSDYAALASARANQVKEFLTQAGKVEPERIFLSEGTEAATKGKGSRVYLHLR